MKDNRGSSDVRRVPQDVDSEKSILSTILFDPDKFDLIADKLKSEDFYSTSNQAVFVAMGKLSMAQTTITRQSVADQLGRDGRLDAVGGVAYLSELIDYDPSALSLEYLVDSVKNKALQRRLVETAQIIAVEGMSPTASIDELLEESERRLFELLQEKYRPSYVPLEQIVREVFKGVERRMTEDNPVLGVQTGFSDLDDLLSGLVHSNLIILAARPSMGKTAFALNIGANAALRYKVPVVIFSLEMSRQELGFRLCAAEARVDAKRLKEGKISAEEQSKFFDAVKKLLVAPIIVDDTPSLGILELRARARQLKKQNMCGLIVIDYLQLLKGSGFGGSGQSREQEIAEISRMLKATAKELDVHVVALSQLNRMLETRENKRPKLSDLRESGAIEQDADVIMFIYRDDYYNKESKDKGMAEIIVGKQRNGPTGLIKLAFMSEHTRFENLERGRDDMNVAF